MPGSVGSTWASHASRSGCERSSIASSARRLAIQRTADGEQLVAELRLDVGDDPVVRGRGGAEHRHAAGQEIEDASEAAVVGPEVVAPVADAVHLVDDEQAGAGRDRAAAPCSRNAWFAKRSGETRSTSIVLASSSAMTSSQTFWLSLLIVAARRPPRSAASIWLRMRPSRGETSSVGPAPRARSSAVVTK